MDIEKEIVSHAVEDMQRWMANAPSITTEASVLAWQQGYIAGVQRAISTHDVSSTEEYD
jgi:hypothetical protein